MSPNRATDGYFSGCNTWLLKAISPRARKVLDVGCAEGRLGAELKCLDAERCVYGVEVNASVAARAAERLDRVFCIDFANEDVPLEPGSVDSIVCGDVLEHLVEPETALRRLRPLLAPGGELIASIPNLQHHSMLAALLSGDFQYLSNGLLDATHLRFFTASTILKLFLDAGYEPRIVDKIRTGCPPGLVDDLRPVLKRLGLDAGRTEHYLGNYQYIVRGRPLDDVPTDVIEVPLSFVACVTGPAILAANLGASPCLAPGEPHELISILRCPSAADGLELGLERARHDWVVWVHQDVYLPRGWPARLAWRLREALRAFGPIGVAGVYGVARVGDAHRRAGHLIDRDRLLAEDVPLPARVESLDELLLIMPRSTRLRMDRELGYHLYGADLCLQAEAIGLPAVALDVPCLHNTRSIDVPASFAASVQALRAKWPDRLPLATPCAWIEREGPLQPV